MIVKLELYNHDADGDRPASFATDAEIELAERLRHRLEERYLGSAAHLQSQVTSGEGDRSNRSNGACASCERVVGSNEQLELETPSGSA